MKNLSKSMKWISVILLFFVVIAIVYSYSKDKGSVLDKMTNYNSSPSPMSMSGSHDMMSNTAPSMSAGMQPHMQQMQQMQQPQMQQHTAENTGYDMHPVANPADLLPNDQNSQWANLNPLNGSVPVPVDLLQAGYQIGLDTIGQTLKNANLQLRSDPIIEKKNVGPWMQSTIEPDYGRVPLEIGYGSR